MRGRKQTIYDSKQRTDTLRKDDEASKNILLLAHGLSAFVDLIVGVHANNTFTRILKV